MIAIYTLALWKYNIYLMQRKWIIIESRNSDVILEYSRPEPHYEFTAFFLLRTDHYNFIIYYTYIYNNKNLVFTVKS